MIILGFNLHQGGATATPLPAGARVADMRRELSNRSGAGQLSFFAIA